MSARSRRRWPLVAGAAIAVVGSLYGALWREGAETMRRSIEAFAASERANGRDVAYSDVLVSGFPFLLRGRIDDASIQIADEWRWSGGALFISAAPWAPERLAFSSPSQTLDLGELGRWRIEARSGRAVIGRSRARGWTLRLASREARIAREGARGDFRIERFDALIAPGKNDSSAILVKVEARSVVAAGETQPVSAGAIEIMLRVTDRPPPTGREMQLQRLYVEGEGGKALLSGDFRVDAAGYPEGVLSADVSNPGAFATALGKVGAIATEDAEEAAAALSLAAIAGGGKIAAPLVLADGVASIAGVAVAKLPRVED